MYDELCTMTLYICLLYCKFLIDIFVTDRLNSVTFAMASHGLVIALFMLDPISNDALLPCLTLSPKVHLSFSNPCSKQEKNGCYYNNCVGVNYINLKPLYWMVFQGNDKLLLAYSLSVRSFDHTPHLKKHTRSVFVQSNYLQC